MIYEDANKRWMAELSRMASELQALGYFDLPDDVSSSLDLQRWMEAMNIYGTKGRRNVDSMAV